LLEDLQCADESSLIQIEELLNKNDNSVADDDAESNGLLNVATAQIEKDMNGSDGFNGFLKRCSDNK
jgi:hypothetical protein